MYNRLFYLKYQMIENLNWKESKRLQNMNVHKKWGSLFIYFRIMWLSAGQLVQNV